MADNLHILILEDNLSDVKLLKNEIISNLPNSEIVAVDNKDDFIKELSSFKPDIVLSDYSLPQYNGMDALKYVKGIDNDFPFILITGSLNEEIAVECMKAGADDYILKDSLKRVPLAIKSVLKNYIQKLEKKSALEELKESETRYRNFITISPEAILVHNSNVITFANSAAATMLGYESPIELIGKTISEFVDPKFIPIFKQKIMPQSDGDTVIPTVEQRLIKNDGSFVEVEVSACKFSEKNQNSILVVLRDITKQKKIHEELINAKEKAEASNRFKTTLMSNMSHEFRTPMNGILGFAQILKDDLDDPLKEGLVEGIIRSGKRLMHTLNSILDLSQIEAERLEANIKKENLADLTLYVIKFFKEDFEEKNIDLKSDEYDNEIYCNLDAELYKEILSNILENALKFTNEGEVKVIVRKEIKNGNEYGCVDVIDTGIGISDEHKSAIFEPFKQLSEGLSRGFEGAGLGLTISQKMTHLMGGIIEVKSNRIKGSTFTIYFPMSTDLVKVVPEYENEIDEGELKTKSSETLTKPKVLLVEDNFINKDVTMMYLKEICKIDHAANGEKALDMVLEEYYDLILMDINLGMGIDGIETMRRIRMIDSCKNIPVVALTGYTMREDRKKFLDEGFYKYLPKPYEKFEIIKLVEEIISEKRNN